LPYAWRSRLTGRKRTSSLTAIRGPKTALLTVLVLVMSPAEHGLAASTGSIQKELDSLAKAYGNLEVQIGQTEARRTRLTQEKRNAERIIASRAAALRNRAGYMYKNGGANSFLGQLLTAPNLNVFIKRVYFLSVLGKSDSELVEGLTISQARSDRVSAELDATAARQRALANDLRSRRRQLEAKFQEVTRIQDAQRREAQARLRAGRVADQSKRRQLEATARGEVSRKVVSAGRFGRFSLPIAGPAGFTDTWGARRGGGRRHQGTDVMAPCGAPVVAVTDGVVSRLASGGAGGTMAYLKAGNGDQFFYAHLQSYAAGIGQGKRVSAGEVIAYNGRSGNARGGPCHVHFEWHPGGGRPSNPYPLLAGAR
jgi:murein DD-endopeptidase MepM/ murein hydrolase activator NlpD